MSLVDQSWDEFLVGGISPERYMSFQEFINVMKVIMMSEEVIVATTFKHSQRDASITTSQSAIV